MPNPNTVATLVQFAVLLGAAVGIYAGLSKGLRELLDKLLKLPAGTTFYLRSFALVLVFVALEEALSPIDLDPSSAFMEFVWAEARTISSALGKFYVVLMVYLGLVTVLTAVLRRRDAE